MNLHQVAAAQMAMNPPGMISLPGLPAVRLPGLANKPGFSGQNLGGTITNLYDTSIISPTNFVPVLGVPSMTLTRLRDGGAATVVRRRSQYAKYISPENLAAMQALMERIVAYAVSMSKGPLKDAALAALGNPYGRSYYNPSGKRRGGLGRLQGRQAGVSNMAVVNEQTGKFAGSWQGDVSLQGDEVVFMLANVVEYAWWLAHGTTLMKAHGPFTTAMLKFLQELNLLFLKATKEAALLQAALRAVAMPPTMRQYDLWAVIA